MFAGAVREEVFSLESVIARCEDEFIPIAISVPRLMRGDDAESRLYRSLTNQRPPPTSGVPVPQGICVTNANGRVLGWIQVFEDEPALHAFFDRCADEFRADPEAPGDEPVAESHESCPLSPPPVRGSLYGTVHGRAEHDGERQSRYMQERVTITSDIAEELAAGALSRESAMELLREAYLGQKDVAPLFNPLGVESQVIEMEFIIERDGSLAHVTGRFNVVAERDRFRHSLDLDWEGFLEFDDAGLTRVTLLGRGMYELQWPGFEREEERFRTLMAGRAIDEAGGVRFGIVAERCDDGVEEAAGAMPRSLQRKMERLHAGIERLQREGGDMRPIMEVMQRFQPLMQEGRFEEAERVLDEALERLEP